MAEFFIWPGAMAAISRSYPTLQVMNGSRHNRLWPSKMALFLAFHMTWKHVRQARTDPNVTRFSTLGAKILAESKLPQLKGSNIGGDVYIEHETDPSPQKRGKRAWHKNILQGFPIALTNFASGNHNQTFFFVKYLTRAALYERVSS